MGKSKSYYDGSSPPSDWWDDDDYMDAMFELDKAAAMAGSIGASHRGVGIGTPGNVAAAVPTVDLNFLTGVYSGLLLTDIVLTRASSATDLLYTSASGAAYNTYGTDVKRIVAGSGFLIERATTNLLLNSNAPVTQTVTLSTGTHTLWVNGSGSATPSGVTATITGAAAAVNGTPDSFTVTVAGDVLITVSGSLNAFQLETGFAASSFVITAGATAARAQDFPSVSGAAFTSFYSAATAMTVYVESFTGHTAAQASINEFIFSIDDSSANNRFQLFRSTGGDSLFSRIVQGGLTTNPGNMLTQPFSSSVMKTAIATGVGAAQGGTASNGALSTTSNPAGKPAANILHLGIADSTTSPLNGFLRRFQFYNTRLSGAAMQTLTT